MSPILKMITSFTLLFFGGESVAAMPPETCSMDSELVEPSDEGPPILSIHVRGLADLDDRNLPYLEDANEAEISCQSTYMSFFPEPHFDEKDVNVSTREGSPLFTIGGRNETEIIRRIKSITGVSLETLSLRARGSSVHGFGPSEDEWEGVAGVGMRSSWEGFLAPQRDLDSEGEALRNLLIADNELVLGKGLTHQELATPILKAIEAYVLYEKTDMEFNGRHYRLSPGWMGGSVDLVPLSPRTEEERQREAELVRLRSSGWTGRGVQGSVFRDELFSNRVFEFTDMETNQIFSIDGLTPHLIYRYGFYQGGPYRAQPEAIIDFFKLN